MGTLPSPGPLSRREFLKLGCLGLLGIALPAGWVSRAGAQSSSGADFLGRVLDTTIQLYDRPSFSGKMVKTLWKDVVVPITGITVGDSTPAYNRVWYRINAEGYAHSGGVQPVRLELHEPARMIPPDGQLAEVTVPFTDARKEADPEAFIAYRLYYGTTHWAVTTVKTTSGDVWYELQDDRMKTHYYALARHLRLFPPKELEPISPQVPMEGKRIEVHLSHQAIIAYEWDRPVFMSRAATGARFSGGDYRTEPGRYIVNRKRPTRHMAAGDRAAANSFDLPGVPWISYFTEDGISFHGTYWHNDYGKTRSHGCVNLPIQAARWIYLWTLPYVPASTLSVFETFGTIVDVI